MKTYLHKTILGLSTLCMAMAAVPSQAQTWTNASGTPLAIGTPVTFSAAIDFSLFGTIGRKVCSFSMEGTVVTSGTITFTHDTAAPGACFPTGTLGIAYPFTIQAAATGTSPTGEAAITPSILFVPGGIGCSPGALLFAWDDAPISEGRIIANTYMGGSPCYVHAGSKLTATSPAGNISIN